MKMMVDPMIIGHVVIFIFLWAVIHAEQYVIIQRNNNGTSSTSKVRPDRFIIPSFLCAGNGSGQCKEMGGSRVGDCTCECNRRASNGADFSSSTFGFDGGRWKCIENTKVRERSGCSIILNNWANDSSLITVPKADVAKYEIPTQFSRSFHIYKATSKAQNCDNSWSDLDYDTYIKERFSVHRIGNKQYLQFNYSGNSSQQIMSGRIIKLGVGYHNESNLITHTCVLLKKQGEIKCPFSLPPTATPSITDPSSVLYPPTESSLSASTSSATTANTHTTLNNHTKSSGPRMVTMSTEETSVPKVIKTSARNTSFEDRNGLIAGAVVGVIGLIVLVGVIIFVRKRKKRETVTKKTSVVAENNGFATNRVQPSLEDQDEYSYAYASAISIKRRNLDHHPRNTGAQNDVTTEYAKVDKTASKTTPSNKQDEPLYNVLEGPDGPNENEPPCYDVLEGPYPDNGPVYDVLEEPGSVPHLPNQNSARKRPNRSNVENRDYNDTVYDSVEEVIPDTGDIYQKLNQDTQREPGVYQTLTYGNQAMPLTKLNATHSEA